MTDFDQNVAAAAAAVVRQQQAAAAAKALSLEPFMQGQTGTHRTYAGAGLGLPVARTLAESMGCRLTLMSEIGVGSRFVLLLPVQTLS